jgi:hypothetical protein
LVVKVGRLTFDLHAGVLAGLRILYPGCRDIFPGRTVTLPHDGGTFHYVEYLLQGERVALERGGGDVEDKGCG